MKASKLSGDILFTDDIKPYAFKTNFSHLTVSSTNEGIMGEAVRVLFQQSH